MSSLIQRQNQKGERVSYLFLLPHYPLPVTPLRCWEPGELGIERPAYVGRGERDGEVLPGSLPDSNCLLQLCPISEIAAQGCFLWGHLLQRRLIDSNRGQGIEN